MSLLTKRFYQRTAFLSQNSYVETGTYKGENLEAIIDSSLFDNIYSLELDAKWYEYNKNRFSDKGNVHFYHGDSAELLPLVLDKKIESCIFFLDAHYSGPGTAMGIVESPLLSELHTLSQANLTANCVIIIDDCRMLGKKGLTENSKNYQAFDSDWSEITQEEISRILGTNWLRLTNNNRHWSDGKEDQFIFLKIEGLRRTRLQFENYILERLCSKLPQASSINRFFLQKLLLVLSN